MSNKFITTTKCKGLYYSGNEYNAPEGSLCRADNVWINRDDVIEPRFGFDKCGNGLPLSKTESMFSSDDYLFTNTNGRVFVTGGDCNYSELITSDAAKIGYPLSMIRIGDNLYFTVMNAPAVFRISSDGVVYLFAGSLTVNGHVDGALLTARFDTNFGRIFICAGGDGNIYLSEWSVIRKINLSTGMVSTICGTYGITGAGVDGIGAAVVFDDNKLLCGPDNNSVYIYVVDNCTIRRINTSTGNVLRISGDYANDNFVDGDLGVNAIGDIYGVVCYGNSSYLYALCSGYGGAVGDETRILRISLTGPTYTVSSRISGRSEVPVDGDGSSGKISYDMDFNHACFQRRSIGTSLTDVFYFIEKGRIRYFTPDLLLSVPNNWDYTKYNDGELVNATFPTTSHVLLYDNLKNRVFFSLYNFTGKCGIRAWDINGYVYRFLSPIPTYTSDLSLGRAIGVSLDGPNE